MPKEILMEQRKVGNGLWVRAIDPITFCEVDFQAPLGSPREALMRLARQKLTYVQKKGNKKD